MSTITSEHWIAVRRFVEQVRLQAHETVVDKSIIQDIFDVVDAHGIEMVQSMIQHEKRLIGANNIQKFYMQKDWQDEEDFQRAEAKETNRPSGDDQPSEASHGISK